MNTKLLHIFTPLPATIISRSPFVFASYDVDFLNNVNEFSRVLQSVKSPVLLMQLGWQHELNEDAERLAAGIRNAMRVIPSLRIVILSNSVIEMKVLKTYSLEAVYCHQNAFLDEKRYMPIPGIKKKYDAIYIARITPFKRHLLATSVNSIHLVGGYSSKEKDYALSVHASMPNADFTPKARSYHIYKLINQAYCGLCLSEIEGAMFVSAEYLLCGIPVVNTKNIGGRDGVMPEFAVKNVENKPEAVAKGVEYWRENIIDPYEIRNSTINLMKPHRDNFKDLVRSLGVKNPYIPHKLGLRSGRLADIFKALIRKTM